MLVVEIGEGEELVAVEVVLLLACMDFGWEACGDIVDEPLEVVEDLDYFLLCGEWRDGDGDFGEVFSMNMRDTTTLLQGVDNILFVLQEVVQVFDI